MNQKIIDLENFFKNTLNLGDLDISRKKEIANILDSVPIGQMGEYESVLNQAISFFINSQDNINDVVFTTRSQPQRIYNLNSQDKIRELIEDNSFEHSKRYFRRLEYFTKDASLEREVFRNNDSILDTFMRIGFKQRRHHFQELYTFIVLLNGIQMVTQTTDRRNIFRVPDNNQLVLNESHRRGKKPAAYIEIDHSSEKYGVFYQAPVQGYSKEWHIPDISLALFTAESHIHLDLNNVMGIVECKDVEKIDKGLSREFLGYLVEIAPLFFIIVSSNKVTDDKGLNKYGIKILDSMDPTLSIKQSFFDEFSNSLSHQIRKKESLTGFMSRCSVIDLKKIKEMNFNGFLSSLN